MGIKSGLAQDFSTKTGGAPGSTQTVIEAKVKTTGECIKVQSLAQDARAGSIAPQISVRAATMGG